MQPGPGITLGASARAHLLMGLPGAIIRAVSHPELFAGPGMHYAPLLASPAGSQVSAGAPLPPGSLPDTLLLVVGTGQEVGINMLPIKCPWSGKLALVP